MQFVVSSVTVTEFPCGAPWTSVATEGGGFDSINILDSLILNIILVGVNVKIHNSTNLIL